MNYKDIGRYLKELSDFLNEKHDVDGGITIKEVFNPDVIPFIGDRTDENRHAIPYPENSELSQKSGIYIFLKENGDILYIGKATENNVRKRIFDHLQTPVRSDKEGWVLFPNNKFDSDIVREGKVKVGIFEVVPKAYSSLVEVYLHTIKLPEYCKRIG